MKKFIIFKLQKWLVVAILVLLPFIMILTFTLINKVETISQQHFKYSPSDVHHYIFDSLSESKTWINTIKYDYDGRYFIGYCFIIYSIILLFKFRNYINKRPTVMGIPISGFEILDVPEYPTLEMHQDKILARFSFGVFFNLLIAASTIPSVFNSMGRLHPGDLGYGLAQIIIEVVPTILLIIVFSIFLYIAKSLKSYKWHWIYGLYAIAIVDFFITIYLCTIWTGFN